MTAPVYDLRLYKTYWDKGFFNIGVDFSRYVRKNSGPIVLLLGEEKAHQIDAWVDRNANSSGAPRVHGGAVLRDWFHRNCNLKGMVRVHIISPQELWLKP